MIQTFIPWREDTNLGAAYNEAMEMLPEDGWAVLLDHDVMFTTFEWHRQIDRAIAAEPYGSFTGVTNRIFCPWQKAREADQNNHDILYHRALGEARLSNRYLTDVTDATGAYGWGGYIMILSKAAWRDAGKFVDGQLCVDHQMHFALRRAKRRVFLIEGLYIYHYARGRGEQYQAKTLAATCECRTVTRGVSLTDRRAI